MSKKKIIYFGIPIFLFALVILGLSDEPTNPPNTQQVAPRVEIAEDLVEEKPEETSEAIVEEVMDTMEEIIVEDQTVTPLQDSIVEDEEIVEELPSLPIEPVSDGHTWYLSTHHTAKFYYCDTDPGWEGLSEKYLKSYPSEAALLADRPSYVLHEPCK